MGSGSGAHGHGDVDGVINGGVDVDDNGVVDRVGDAGGGKVMLLLALGVE